MVGIKLNKNLSFNGDVFDPKFKFKADSEPNELGRYYFEFKSIATTTTTTTWCLV